MLISKRYFIQKNNALYSKNNIAPKSVLQDSIWVKQNGLSASALTVSRIHKIILEKAKKTTIKRVKLKQKANK